MKAVWIAPVQVLWPTIIVSPAIVAIVPSPVALVAVVIPALFAVSPAVITTVVISVAVEIAPENRRHGPEGAEVLLHVAFVQCTVWRWPSASWLAGGVICQSITHESPRRLR